MLGTLKKPELLFCPKMAGRHWPLILSSAKKESNNFLNASMNLEDQIYVKFLEKE